MFSWFQKTPKKPERPLSETHIDGSAATNPVDGDDEAKPFSGLGSKMIDSYTEMVDNQSNFITKHNSLFSEQLGIGTDDDNLRQMDARDRFIVGSHARALYRGLDMLQRVIDAPVEDSLRNGWKRTTTLNDPELDKILDVRQKELNFREKLELFMKWSRLYARGAIFYPVLTETVMDASNRSHLEKPLDLDTIEFVKKINVIPEDKYTFIINRNDPLSESFYEIEHVNILGSKVDSSRFLLHILDLDPEFGRGISMANRTFTGIVGINLAEWTISTLLIQYKMLLIKFPAKDTQDTKKRAAIKTLLRKIQKEFTSKSVAAIPDTYDFEHLTTVFTGIKEATTFLWEFLSALTGIPQSILRGSALGELASAEKDVNQYHERIKSEEQEAKARPAIEWLTTLLLHERNGPARAYLDSKNINPSEVEPVVEFMPLESENSQVRAQRQLVDTQRGALDINAGIRGTPEVRADLYPELESSEREPNQMTPEQEENLQKDVNDILERAQKVLQPVS